MNKFLTLALIALALACKSPEARRPVSVKSGSFIDESVERNKKLNAEEQALIEKFINQKQ